MKNKLFGRRDERGTTLVLVTIFALAIFGFAALSIDVGRVRYEQRKAHIATDAGAFAGVLGLSTSSSEAISIATSIAQANGIKNGELSASTGVEVGNWDTDTSTFTPNPSSLPINAIRVAARRTVPLYFGPVVGLRNMGPAVSSVAYLPPSGLVPFGVEGALVSGVASNTEIVLSRANAGNWGKLNLGPDMTKNPHAWENAFINGYTGPLGTSAIVNGEQVYYAPTDPGFAFLIDTWNTRKASNPIVTFPIVHGNFPNGRSADVMIYAFATVELRDQNGRSGNNWEGTIKLLSISSTPPSSSSTDRRLVE